jgi:hypothetical protein
MQLPPPPCKIRYIFGRNVKLGQLSIVTRPHAGQARNRRSISRSVRLFSLLKRTNTSYDVYLLPVHCVPKISGQGIGLYQATMLEHSNTHRPNMTSWRVHGQIYTHYYLLM